MKLVLTFIAQAKGIAFLKFMIISFLFLQGTSLFSATIYIDPTFQGSNQNGSQSNPYKSWNNINLSSGNTYLQKSGTTASTGQISLTGKSNITFGAYGTGSKPKIITSGSGNSVFYITNSNSITIKDLEITSSGNWKAGIIIQGSSSYNNVIRNCWIHRVEWGIRILTSAAGTKILYTKINDILDDGIFVQDARSIEIGYCTIFDINKKYLTNTSQSYAAGDGIQLNSTNSLTFNIHHNTIDHSSMGNKFCFYVWGNNYSGVLEYNTFIGNVVKQSNGVFLNNTSNTIIVRYNTFTNGNYGIITYASKLDAYYNRFIANKTGILVNPGYSLNSRNNVFYNNTKYGISSSYNTNVTLRNNIFNISSPPAKAFYFMGNISSNNNIFSTQYSGFINGYSSLSSWKNSGNDNNSVVSNPKFVNPANSDFHVQSGSVAINKGQNINLTRDYYGNPVPLNGNPDIGIHEYGGTKSSEISIIETDSIGSDTLSSSSVIAYPNPSPDGIFTLQFGEGYDEVTIMAFDVTGNKLKDVLFIKPERESLDLSAFPPGTYLLRIQSANNLETLKVLVR